MSNKEVETAFETYRRKVQAERDELEQGDSQISQEEEEERL
jgi:hypothetical protein